MALRIVPLRALRLGDDFTSKIRSYLSRTPRKPDYRIYRAYVNGKVVVEARTLIQLGIMLRKAGIDPRVVEIRFAERARGPIHVGMRAKVNLVRR